MSEHAFTLVFKGDIRAIKGNPFKTETPFGIPYAVAVGDKLEELDRLEEFAASCAEATEIDHQEVLKSLAARQQWHPIETAPKDGTTILVWGHPASIELVTFHKPGAFTASWDSLDEAFCLSGGTWAGPFIEPTHWMPLPAAPEFIGR